MLMESKPRTIYWFSLSQKKKHLNRIREIQFRETSADTERIKYNTKGVKTESSKNIDLLKVKRRHSWIHWSNKIQQHFCWSPVDLTEVLNLLDFNRSVTESCFSTVFSCAFSWLWANQCFFNFRFWFTNALIYKCTKRKIIASKHEKQNKTSQNIGQYVYYNCLLTRLTS